MNESKSGLFVSLEGPEGSGKSTNSSYISELLSQAGIKNMTTREPGGTGFGESLRNILLNKQTGNLNGKSELLLMFAARLEHVEHVIKPQLKQANWVICDRFTDSSYAYQGGGRGLSFDKISQLEKWTLGEFKPNLTLLLDVSVETTLSRVKSRGELDRFEDQETEFFYRIREAFLQLAKNTPERYRIIDANQPIDVVQAEISNIINPLIEQWLNK